MQKAVMPAELPDVVPPAKRKGRILAVLTTPGRGTWDFPTSPIERLELDLEGIVGDRHHGWIAKADSRVPYLKRGTPMRNSRHVSLVGAEELAEVAAALAIERIEPGWVGANLLVERLPHLSFLPAGTRLMCPGGVILKVEAQNAPCRYAGKAIANQVPGRPDIELAFAKVAQRRRGIVASIEHGGTLTAGPLEARLPEQWLYPA